jgi:hypothetical protein
VIEPTRSIHTAAKEIDMHRCASIGLIAMLCAGPAYSINESTTIVLHANDGPTTCEGPQQAGLDCETVMATVDATGMDLAMVMIYYRHYDDAVCLQCAFDWPASWTYAGTSWGCQTFQITVPQPSAPGPVAGSVTTCFNVITGGMLAPIGAMIYASPGDGCLDIIESGYPFGTHVTDSGGGMTPIAPENRGRVCVGPGGYDACEPAATPVEPTTWSNVKLQYR